MGETDPEVRSIISSSDLIKYVGSISFEEGLKQSVRSQKRELCAFWSPNKDLLFFGNHVFESDNVVSKQSKFSTFFVPVIQIGKAAPFFPPKYTPGQRVMDRF